MSSARPSLLPLAQSLLAIVIGMVLGGVFMVAFGYNPISAYYVLFRGSFGSLDRFCETLAFAAPLALTGITFAIGVKAGLFNIGAEGQMYIGAVAVTAAAGAVSLPSGLHVAFATAVAMLAGALWALPAALLKVWRGVHEVISTIMLNWIAYWLSMYLIIYHLADPTRAERGLPALPTARYPVLIRGSTLTAVIFIVLAFCFLLWLFMRETKLGYELRLAGANPDAARYAGVNVTRAMVVSFVIGGLAAGLAGASQIIGRPPAWSLYATLGNVIMLGFDGIGVALIGRNDPLGCFFAAIFYGALQNGGRYMQYYLGVPYELVRAINGLIVIALAAPELLNMFRRWLKV